MDPTTVSYTRGRRVRGRAEDPEPPPGGSSPVPDTPEELVREEATRPKPPPRREEDLPSPHHHRAAVEDDDSDLSPTRTLVAEMWRSELSMEGIAGWQPQEVDATLARPGLRRLVYPLLALILLAGAGGIWIWYSDGARSARATSEVQTVAARLADATAGVTAVASDLSDGSVDDLYSATTELGRFAGDARSLFDAASAIPGTDLGAAPVRRDAADVAAEALEMEATLGDALAYGQALGLVLATPDLPTAASPDDVPAVAADLAGWATSFIDTASGLPHHARLADHREQVAGLADSLEAWQAGYLDALREGDTGTARSRLGELGRQLDAIEAGWRSTADDVASWVMSTADRVAAEAHDLSRAR